MERYIGEIIIFGGSNPPPKCIGAGGQAISRTTYSELFAVYGETYGAGDGINTFNVPDIRGRVIAGPNEMGGSAADRLTNSCPSETGVSGSQIGNTGGTQNHKLDGGVVSVETPDYGGTTVSVSEGQDHNVLSANYNPSSGGLHNNVQPTIIIPFVIYTGVS